MWDFHPEIEYLMFMADSTIRICLFSSPRNVSTAFMYSWAQRPDTKVVDEPLYAHYLKVSGVDHPGKEDILASMEADSEKVIEQVFLGPCEKPVLFLKHMAHHTIQLDPGFMEKVISLFFIRDPKKIIQSYSKVIDQPVMEDIGIKRQFELFSFAKENGFPAIVLDSGELLKNPEVVLKKLCGALGIPFFREMLAWQAGARKEDGVWAKYWYNNVHQSTGFANHAGESDDLSPDYEALYREAIPYYNTLYKESIKA